MQEFISFTEARDLVLSSVSFLGTEDVRLEDSRGRTLAESVTSRENIPPFDNSAMDGYAVRAGDAPGPLDVIGEIPAGSMPSGSILPGTCMRIMTGGPIPVGADAVVPVELTRKVSENAITISGSPAGGDHIRVAGGDIRAGEEAETPGSVITPATMAVLAALGYDRVRVAREPRVAVVTTGNELVDVNAQPGPGQIRDSNGPALSAQVLSAGGSLLRTFRAGDDRTEIRRTLENALAADVVVVSGGVSVGEYDLVKEELERLGLRFLFWKVRQRPGKPLAFGLLNEIPVFGLPGNPVSSAVCFYEYVRPALAVMLGRRDVSRPLVPAASASAIDKRPGLHHFLRGIAVWRGDSLEVNTAGPQGSHVATTMARANCLVHLAEGAGPVAPGERVSIEWLEW